MIRLSLTIVLLVGILFTCTQARPSLIPSELQRRSSSFDQFYNGLLGRIKCRTQGGNYVSKMKECLKKVKYGTGATVVPSGMNVKTDVTLYDAIYKNDEYWDFSKSEAFDGKKFDGALEQLGKLVNLAESNLDEIKRETVKDAKDEDMSVNEFWDKAASNAESKEVHENTSKRMEDIVNEANKEEDKVFEYIKNLLDEYYGYKVKEYSEADKASAEGTKRLNDKAAELMKDIPKEDPENELKSPEPVSYTDGELNKKKEEMSEKVSKVNDKVNESGTVGQEESKEKQKVIGKLEEFSTSYKATKDKADKLTKDAEKFDEQAKAAAKTPVGEKFNDEFTSDKDAAATSQTEAETKKVSSGILDNVKASMKENEGNVANSTNQMTEAEENAASAEITKVKEEFESGTNETKQGMKQTTEKAKSDAQAARNATMTEVNESAQEVLNKDKADRDEEAKGKEKEAEKVASMMEDDLKKDAENIMSKSEDEMKKIEKENVENKASEDVKEVETRVMDVEKKAQKGNDEVEEERKKISEEITKTIEKDTQDNEQMYTVLNMPLAQAKSMKSGGKNNKEVDTLLETVVEAGETEEAIDAVTMSVDGMLMKAEDETEQLEAVVKEEMEMEKTGRKIADQMKEGNVEPY
eukprot:Nk52_evm7s649 gene=Nk52_evmTU7s649